MRAVVQRVSSASVTVDEKVVGGIGQGLLVLVAVRDGDTERDARWLANKVISLRLFTDADDKMNLSVAEVGGSILAISQFTLYGDCRRGRRPSYSNSAPPEVASGLYRQFVTDLRGSGLEVQEGVFQAHMHVSLVNDGPVTVIVDSPLADREA